MPAPIDPDALAQAVQSCPSVARLSAGVFGEAATYLPGRRVPGVRLTDTTVEVHVVGLFGITVDQIAREVRAAVAPLVDGRPVDVVISDLALGGPQHDGQAQRDAGDRPTTYGTFTQFERFTQGS